METLEVLVLQAAPLRPLKGPQPEFLQRLLPKAPVPLSPSMPLPRPVQMHPLPHQDPHPLSPHLTLRHLPTLTTHRRYPLAQVTPLPRQALKQRPPAHLVPVESLPAPLRQLAGHLEPLHLRLSPLTHLLPHRDPHKTQQVHHLLEILLTRHQALVHLPTPVLPQRPPPVLVLSPLVFLLPPTRVPPLLHQDLERRLQARLGPVESRPTLLQALVLRQ